MPPNYSFKLICLSNIFLLLCACHNSSSNEATASSKLNPVILADEVNAARRGTVMENELAYILSDTTVIYEMDSARILRPVAVLHMGEPLGVFNNGDPFMNMYYSASWHAKEVYVWGTDLGQKSYDVDIDFDNRPDTILYGYTNYDTSSIENYGARVYPLLLRFITSKGARYDIVDKGYSEVGIQEITDSNTVRFSHPTKLLTVSAGYPACAFLQYNMLLIATGGKAKVVHHFLTNMDSGYGNFYDISLPTSANGRVDTICLTEILNSAPENNGDTIIATPIDSSYIFPVGDKWQVDMFWKSKLSTDKN